MASEIPATTPTRLMTKRVVGGIRRVVHLKAYSSPKSSSSDAFDVTVKLVSIPASIFRSPCTTAKRCADTPPITQNCSFLHHSSMLTPLHLSSRMPVVKIERNRAIKNRLAKVLIWIKNKRMNSRKGTVGKQRYGGKWIDGCVDISKPLKPFKLSTLVTIP